MLCSTLPVAIYLLRRNMWSTVQCQDYMGLFVNEIHVSDVDEIAGSIGVRI